MRSKKEILDDLLNGGFLIDPDDEDYVAEAIQLAEAAGMLEWTYYKVVSKLPHRLLILHRGFRPWPKPTPPGYSASQSEAPLEQPIADAPEGEDAEPRQAGTTATGREGM